MNLIYKRKLVKILQVCKEFHGHGKTKKWLKESLRRIIDSFPDFTRNEKARLYETAFKTAVSPVEVTVTERVGTGGRSLPPKKEVDFARPSNCKDLVQTLGKIERRTSSRKQKLQIKDTIARARDIGSDQSGRFPMIFYMCSSHSKPAKDHADYQGKIYVDRYWRKYCTGTVPEWLIAAVEDFIQKNEIISIQKIMGPPVWLCTRPYCKHKLYPVNTLTVLTEDPKTYLKKTYGTATKRGATYEYIKKHL
jgi:hypothetical protein